MSDFTFDASRVTSETSFRTISVEVEGVDEEALLDQIGIEKCKEYFDLTEKE